MKFEEFVSAVARAIELLDASKLLKPPEIQGRIAVFTFPHGTGKLHGITDLEVRATALFENRAPIIRNPERMNEATAYTIAKFLVLR